MLIVMQLSEGAVDSVQGQVMRWGKNTSSEAQVVQQMLKALKNSYNTIYST